MKKTALNREKTKFENSKVIFIAPAVVIIWLLIIYALKGVFPFGDNNIIQYDLFHGTVPGYYYLWDAFHGGSLFYDFTTACGFGRGMLNSLFYPTNIFILLLKREWIYNGVSILLILKLAVVAFTSSYTFSKIFPKLPSYYTLLITVMYTFCGYNLMYYTNIDWLDTVALYPLIILFALNMFKGKSKLPYFLVLTYTLIFNTYMAWFVVISLVVFGGTYIFTVESKENRRRDIYCLGTGTGAALAASAYYLYSFYGGITAGARFNRGTFYKDAVTGAGVQTNGLIGMLKTPSQIDLLSVLMFLGMTAAFAFLVILWVRCKKNKATRRPTVFFTIILAFFIIEGLVTACLLLWHGGSFQYFPYRNGYMIAFFGCLVIGYYLSEFGESKGIVFKKNVLNIIPFAICLILVLTLFSFTELVQFTLRNLQLLNENIKMQFGMAVYPFSRFVIVLFLLLITYQTINYKKARSALTALTVAVLVLANSYTLVQNNVDMAQDYYSSQMNISFEVKEQYGNNNTFDRVNDSDANGMMNFGYVANVPTLSNWTHSLTEQQLGALTAMGFSHDNNIQYSTGGTIFSKALLRTTNTFTDRKLSPVLYEKTATIGEINYHNNRYILPIGISFNDGIKNIDCNNFENVFDYQEAIYQCLADENELFNKVIVPAKESAITADYYTNEEDENGNMRVYQHEGNYCCCDYNINIIGKQVLYFALNGNCGVSSIIVNGVDYETSDTLSADTESGNESKTVKPKFFPTNENNNVLELGAFENETVNIEITFATPNASSDDILLYTMDLDKMQELCDSLPENEYTVDGDVVRFSTTAKNDGDIVFVPLGYEDKWNCTVNGEAVKPVCILGDFIGIEVTAGKNDIVLSYSHTSAYISLAAVFAGFALGIALLLLEKKFNDKVPKFVYTVMYAAFAVIYGGAVGILYIIPTGYTVVSKIIELIV